MLPIFSLPSPFIEPLSFLHSITFLLFNDSPRSILITICMQFRPLICAFCLCWEHLIGLGRINKSFYTKCWMFITDKLHSLSYGLSKDKPTKNNESHTLLIYECLLLRWFHTFHRHSYISGENWQIHSTTSVDVTCLFVHIFCSAFGSQWMLSPSLLLRPFRTLTIMASLNLLSCPTLNTFRFFCYLCKWMMKQAKPCYTFQLLNLTRYAMPCFGLTV